MIETDSLGTFPTTPCREWQGHRSPNGYARRKTNQAHLRFGTQLLHRQIMMMAGVDIDGLTVLHRCDNPVCFRFDHLLVGTMADNNLDRDLKGRHANALKTHCKRGHEFTDENTYRSANGKRQCRECKRQWSARA